MKRLQALCAEALALSALTLPRDADREEFADYLGADRRDGSELGRWVSLVVGSGVYRDADEAAAALSGACMAAEPRYPWDGLADLPAPLMAWEVWCFCVARWVRHNDLGCASALPAGFPLDHRHAYAVSGPSSQDAAELGAYVDRWKDSLPDDWLELLVRPEMWRRAVFVAFVRRCGWPAGAAARRLAAAARAALDAGNLEAVATVFRVAHAPPLRDRFWARVERDGTHRDVVWALLAGRQREGR